MRQFGEVESLKQVYAAPALVSDNIEKSLKLYFGLGLSATLLLSIVIATLLSRRIAAGYRATFDELSRQREQVRYLQEISSWQELAKMLAHEIKNPLTPIEVLVSSLSRAYLSKNQQEFAAHLNETQAMIAEELQHLKSTVNKFSEFARLPQVQPAVANVPEALRHHLKAIAGSMNEAQFEVRESDEAATLQARLDGTLFRQVLANMVRNGIEANPGRRVTFTITVSGDERQVRLGISNDGEPVSADMAPRMFDPYISSRGGKDNMGLGLAIVKKIVIEHGGDIRYRVADDLRRSALRFREPQALLEARQL